MRQRITKTRLETKLHVVNELLEMGRHPLRLWYKRWPTGKVSIYWHRAGMPQVDKKYATPAQRIGLCAKWVDAFRAGALSILVRHQAILDREKRDETGRARDLIALKVLEEVVMSAIVSKTVFEGRTEVEGAELAIQAGLFLSMVQERIYEIGGERKER
jgi:hypothetical protein